MAFRYGASDVGIVFAEPGPHAVSMKGRGPEKRVTVQCAAGASVTVAYDEGAPTPPTPPPGERGEAGSWVLPGVLGGVGIVGVGVGLVFSGLATGAKADGEALGSPRCASPQQCPQVQDAVDSLSTKSTIGIVSTIGGGIFLGAGVVAALVVQPWRKRSVSRLAVRFVPGFAAAPSSERFERFTMKKISILEPSSSAWLSVLVSHSGTSVNLRRASIPETVA